MNGRVYDPGMGRFLSVDPVIQSPGNSQSLNPYSYIMNNPLAGTDPTGYAAECSGDGNGKCDVNLENVSQDEIKNIEVDRNGNATVNLKDGTSIAVETHKFQKNLSLGSTAMQDHGFAHTVNAANKGASNKRKNTASADGKSSSPSPKANLVGPSITPTSVPDVVTTPSKEPKPQKSTVTVKPKTAWSLIFYSKELNKGEDEKLAQMEAAAEEEFNRTQDEAMKTFRTKEGGVLLYHGTNKASAVAFLAGAPLQITKALELKHDIGEPGFYLATDIGVAMHFATVQGASKGDGGVVLAYYLSNTALGSLTASGSYFRNIKGNNRFRPPGFEFYIPEKSFSTFNVLRNTGKIKVFPAEIKD